MVCCGLCHFTMLQYYRYIVENVYLFIRCNSDMICSVAAAEAEAVVDQEQLSLQCERISTCLNHSIYLAASY